MSSPKRDLKRASSSFAEVVNNNILDSLNQCISFAISQNLFISIIHVNLPHSFLYDFVRLFRSLRTFSIHLILEIREIIDTLVSVVRTQHPLGSQRSRNGSKRKCRRSLKVVLVLTSLRIHEQELNDTCFYCICNDHSLNQSEYCKKRTQDIYQSIIHKRRPVRLQEPDSNVK